MSAQSDMDKKPCGEVSKKKNVVEVTQELGSGLIVEVGRMKVDERAEETKPSRGTSPYGPDPLPDCYGSTCFIPRGAGVVPA